jgi:hypothetical protein
MGIHLRFAGESIDASGSVARAEVGWQCGQAE